MFTSSSRVGARHSSIIRSMRACASRTLEIAPQGTQIANYSRRAQLFPYRRAVRRTAQRGYAGIIRPFPQIGMQKKASEPEGSEALIPVISLVALSCGDAETASVGTRRYQNASSEASSRYPHSMASVLPSRHSSCTQFLMPSQAECRQVTPCRVSSASETKAGTTSKTHFKLSALSFRFCPKGHCRASFVLGSAENSRFETQPPLSTQATSCNRK